MAELTSEQKVFIVQHIACFHSLSEVAELLHEAYGVEADLPQLARYNPIKKAGQTLSAPLRTVFEQARAEFLANGQDIALSHRNFRLRELEELYRRTKKKGNIVLAAQLLEQAEKMDGGMYTRHAVQAHGEQGGDPLGDLSNDELDRRIAEAEARETTPFLSSGS